MVPLKRPAGATLGCGPSGRLTAEPNTLVLSRRSRVRGGKLYEEHEQIVLTAEVSGDEGELSVEPGESHRETFEFVVASDIDSGIIYRYFYNPQRSLRPRTAEGWYATAMYDITRKA